MTELDESLMQSLNLVDVFGSRYLGDDEVKEMDRDEASPSPETDEDSASESESENNNQQQEQQDGKGDQGKPQQQQAAPVRRRRRQVSKAATGARVVRRGVGQSKSMDAREAALLARVPHGQSAKDNDGMARKTPLKQRRRDPRAQNGGISKGHPPSEEKEKSRSPAANSKSSHPDDRENPRGEGHTQTGASRKVIRKGAPHDSASGALTDTEAQPRRARSRRPVSPRRPSSPRRTMSPRRTPSRGVVAVDNNKATSRGRQESLDATSPVSLKAAVKPPSIVLQRQPADAIQQGALRIPPYLRQDATQSGKPGLETGKAPSLRRVSEPTERPSLQGTRPPSVRRLTEPTPGTMNAPQDGIAPGKLAAQSTRRGTEPTASSRASTPPLDESLTDAERGLIEDQPPHGQDDASSRESDEEEQQPSAAVLQFDPTQTDNVFLAKQVSNPTSEYHLKNKDGTEKVINIAGMEDPLGEIYQSNQNAVQPMFDFLGDQPDEEQQEHTESAEREAMDEAARLREVLPCDHPQVVPKTLTPSAAAVANSAITSKPEDKPEDKPHPPRRRIVKGGPSGKPKPRPRPQEGDSRGPPQRRGVKATASMPVRPRKTPGSHAEPEGKPHKKMVNDAKNYSQFFKDQNEDEPTEEKANGPRHKPRPRPRPRRTVPATDDAESECDTAPRPLRRVKKKPPQTDRKLKNAVSQRSFNDSFSGSTKGRPAGSTRDLNDSFTSFGSRKSKKSALNDSFAFSDTETLDVRRRDRKDFSKPFPEPATDDEGDSGVATGRALQFNPNFASFAAAVPAPLPISPDKPAESKKSLTDPFENSGRTAVDIDAIDTDAPSSPGAHKSKPKLKSVGLAVSIGRYFRKGRGGNGTDVESSDAENSSVVSGLFAKRARKHHLLLDGSSSSMDDPSINFDLPGTL